MRIWALALLATLMLPASSWGAGEWVDCESGLTTKTVNTVSSKGSGTSTRSACYEQGNDTTDSRIIKIRGGEATLALDCNTATDGMASCAAAGYPMRCSGPASGDNSDNDTGCSTSNCERFFHTSTAMNGDNGQTTAQLKWLYDIPEGDYCIDPTVAAGSSVTARWKLTHNSEGGP